MFKTADLCDQYENDDDAGLQVAAPIFRHYGGNRAFTGSIVTLKIFEDNAKVRTILSENGDGKVLVVDGGGSTRCALLGDQLGILAQKNGWAGVVVYGCVRDTDELAKLPLGVVALGTCPRRSVKKDEGDVNVTLHFADVNFVPGEQLFADEDGIIVVRNR
jgi:regulator of ribonuclease activity A